MLAGEHRYVNVQALNLVVGIYLQPFEGVYNIHTLQYGKNLKYSYL